MRIVVDTNRIIAALIKDGASRKLITHLKAEFITINFSKKEIEKYLKLILKKAKIDNEEFERIIEALERKMTNIDDRIIEKFIPKAKKIMDHIDPDDTPFIAAALATKAVIWSEDNHFQIQSKIKVYKTKELLENL